MGRALTTPLLGTRRHYEIVHDNVHRYEGGAARSRNEVRLQPLARPGVHLESFRLDVVPVAEADYQVDHFGNPVWLLSVEAPHLELRVTARSLVSVDVGRQPQGPALAWDRDRLRSSPAVEFVFASPRVPALAAIRAFAEQAGLRPGDWQSLLRANAEMREWFQYSPGSTAVSSQLEEILERRAGVCQDFAHVLIALARHLGWPARYVSGYLLSEAVFEGQSHAWVEVGSADGRWLGLDPTHGVEADDRHLAVAVGRDYSDVPPIKGVFTGERPGLPPQVSVRISARGASVPGWGAAGNDQ